MKFINASNNILKSIYSDNVRTFTTHRGLVVLSSIRWMDFSRNQLSSLDAWILLLAQACDGCVVDFSCNNISTYANLHMSITKRRFDDKSSPYSITLDLKGNYIRNINKMIKGWKFKNPDQLWGFLKNKYERPFKIILESLTCDCRDFAFKLYDKQDDYNLDLTQAICSAPPNLRNRSFSSISINDMWCDITDKLQLY